MNREFTQNSRHHLTIRSDPSELRRVREFGRKVLRDALSAAGGILLVSQIELALHEAVANVIEHAHGSASGGDIRLTGCIGPQTIEIQIAYEGKGFQPAQSPRLPDIPQERGYGLFIISQVMDDVTYTRQGEDSQLIRLIKRLPRQSEE